ncbi:hypothetical protein HPP92_021770 [Vanilla planifolia]|uniref:Uncharacterized protein n=1 Tax=Vanilla planifolia TaxID=51239 RepID=A0A835PW74_VANPL|nr:hypothetical protein HPP92_021770 [Vanilla planifolia]
MVVKAGIYRPADGSGAKRRIANLQPAAGAPFCGRTGNTELGGEAHRVGLSLDRAGSWTEKDVCGHSGLVE